MRLTHRTAGRNPPPARLPGHPRDRRSIIATVLLSLGLLLSGAPLAAADAPAAQASPAAPVTAELLDSKIKEAEASSALDEGTRNSLIELYRKAQSELEAVHGFEEAVSKFTAAQAATLKETEALRKALAQPAPKASLKALGVSERTPKARLQQVLLEQQADKSAAETRLSEIDARVRQVTNRPPEAHQRLSEARRQLDEITASLVEPPVAGEASALTEARRWLLQIRQRSLQAEIQSLDQELLTQPARLELLQAQRDQTARSLALASENVALLQAVAGEQRAAEAEQAQAATAAAQRVVAGKHPLLRELAQQNAKLSDEFAVSAAELEKINRQIEAVKRRTKQYDTDFKSAQQKLDIAGLSEALGRVLLERRRQLPDLARVRASVAAREQVTAALGLRQIRHTEERRDLGDIDAVLDKLLADVPPDARDGLRAEAAALLTSRRGLLDNAIALEGSQLRGMVELDLAERELIDLVVAYDSYLAEHLLWVRSVEPVDSQALYGVAEEIGRLVSPRNWLAAARALSGEARHTPVLALWGAFIVLLLWAAPRMRRMVQASAVRVGDPANDCFMDTVRAMLLVFLRALPWPLLVGLVGWQLERAVSSDGFVKGVGLALQLVAPAYLNLLLFKLLCEPGGVGEIHFRWPGRNTQLLRRQIQRLMLVLLPAGFVLIASGSRGVGLDTLGLSRLGFVVLMLALSYFFARILSLREGVVREPMAARPHGLMARLRYVWYPLAVGVPLVLAGLALFGYFYTAGVLTRSLVNSLWLILALVLVHDLVVRWLLLVRLRLSLQTVKQQEAAASETAAKRPGDVPPVPEPTVDLASVDAGTRKLLNTALQLTLFIGLWIIWSAVLPAFGVLRDIALWQYVATVDGSEQLQPVTLADLGLVVVIAIITAAAARNLPSVFEIALLRQLDVQPGTRYAYAMLLRYLVVGIGLVTVFSIMGGSWSEIQWLVAALGVGIGFGLQEIVANFVSGVIILFERPIRVGDIVTVGDTTGVVSRIRIRATTITNWDRQELVVPNKEFITNRLLNWSLSDPITRITVEVGVAYGTDVAKALQLLGEAVREHPSVLAEPAPLITFDAFGDNALNLKLRCYLPDMEHRLVVKSELQQIINREFTAAGIVIAFPQRDVHLDTSAPLEVRVTTDRDAPPASS